MTDREAIEYAGKELQRTGYTLETNSQLNNGLFKILSTKFEFLVAAISALQEREERSKGCERCQIFENDPQFLFSRGNGQYDEIMFKYCPVCGRKLKTAMPEKGN